MTTTLLFDDIDEPGLNTLAVYEAPRRVRVAAQGAGDDPRGRAQGTGSLRSARARRRGVRDGQEGLVPAARVDRQVPRLQRRRVRAGHVQGPRTDAEDPAHAARGADHRLLRGGREPLVHLHPRRVRPTRPTSSTRRSPKPARPATSASTSSAPSTRCRWSCTAAPARTSAARRPACSDSLEGKRGNPRLKPPFPANQGLYQGPTLINNVETLATVPAIIRMSGAEYAKLGTETSTGTKLVSVSGPRPAPGQLRDRARHPLARDRSTTWPAAPRRGARSSAGSRAAPPRRC